MPGRYYMGIDLRRDHSLRIPRPDISIIYNVPNTCNDCHADKSNQWSEDFIKKYYGEKKRPAYGITLSEGYLHKAGADTNLIKLIKSDLYPEIVRAAALSYLPAYNTPSANSTIKQMLDNQEPIIRERAIDAFNSDNPDELVKTLTPLLNDPVKMVRIAAAAKLSMLAKEYFTEDKSKTLEKVLEEYLNTLKYTADFPSGKYNLGNFYSNKGDYAKAEKFYNDAIKSDSLFFPAKSNLALLYYNTGDLKKAEEMFLDLIRKHPEFTDGNYYLGLLYAEQKKYKEAAEVLEKATLSTKVTPRIYYNLGLIYQYLNNEVKAEASLKKAYSLSPGEFDILYALCDYYIKQKRYQEAEKYANDIKMKFPSNPAGSQISEYIEQIKQQK
jgi:tetratricopeptide (TPR) repeat protein